MKMKNRNQNLNKQKKGALNNIKKNIDTIKILLNETFTVSIISLGISLIALIISIYLLYSGKNLDTNTNKLINEANKRIESQLESTKKNLF